MMEPVNVSTSNFPLSGNYSAIFSLFLKTPLRRPPVGNTGTKAESVAASGVCRLRHGRLSKIRAVADGGGPDGNPTAFGARNSRGGVRHLASGETNGAKAIEPHQMSGKSQLRRLAQ